MDEQAPCCPQYPPPKPGIQEADPRFQKPLMKLIKNLAKPLRQRDPFHTRMKRGRGKMKKVKFH